METIEEYENPLNREIDLGVHHQAHACPNCGSKNIGVTEAKSGIDSVYKVQCRDCHLGGIYCPTVDWAVSDWNNHEWWTVRDTKGDKVVARLTAYDLKAMSCPNCGGQNLNIVQHTDGGVKIQCDNCHVGSPYHHDISRAAQAWNRRDWWKK